MANYKLDRKPLTDDVPLSIKLCGHKKLKNSERNSILPAYRCKYFSEWKDCLKIDFEISEKSISLLISIRFPQYEHGSVTYKVEIVPVQCNYWGVRWWFICPITWEKCLNLYFNGSLGSREGLGLKYASQLESKTYRAYKKLLSVL